MEKPSFEENPNETEEQDGITVEHVPTIEAADPPQPLISVEEVENITLEGGVEEGKEGRSEA